MELINQGNSKQIDDLVDVKAICPTLEIEMKYASTDNFMKRKVYTSDRCLLRKRVAQRLCNAQKNLKTQGLGIKIWDAYRPLSVQWEMWKLVPNPDFVADPRTGSRHNRGAAVDITLISLQTMQDLEMPTGFDDFTPAAAPNYDNLSSTVKSNRQILLDAMYRVGFIQVVATEWWHFDDPDWEQFSVENVPL